MSRGANNKNNGAFKKNHSLIPVRMRFSWIVGRTELRIGASEAKFDARLDCEVQLPATPQKKMKICETNDFPKMEKIVSVFFGVEK